MSSDTLPSDAQTDLRQTIEANIVRNTWGRIHRLEVEAMADHVVVRSCAPSYYVKQLAIQAVLESISVPDARVVEMAIDVVTADLPRRPLPRSVPSGVPG